RLMVGRAKGRSARPLASPQGGPYGPASGRGVVVFGPVGAAPLGGLGGGRQGVRASRFVARPTETDRGERDPDLAEHLDGDEEAREQEQDAEELAELEQFRRSKSSEKIAEACDDRPDRDEDRRRDAAVELAGE